MPKRSLKDFILISIKGICMGAADVVPGVSGGTIAFISGIYEELINSIKSVNLNAFKLFVSGKWKQFWSLINGNFLFALAVGIGISLFTLSRLIKYLLDQYPIFVWSFFFGLIIVSAVVVAKKIGKFRWKEILFILLGTVLAYLFTIISPTETTESYWFLFLCGMLAICAMILPGISGAFILLLLGKYSFLLDAITNFKLLPLAIVAIGAVVGLLSFSNVLSWLLRKYYSLTISFLVGLMLGSLNKVWPWKITVSTYIDRHGIEKPLYEKSVMPHVFENLTGQDAMLMWAILIATIGFLLIYLIEKLATKKSNQS